MLWRRCRLRLWVRFLNRVSLLALMLVVMAMVTWRSTVGGDSKRDESEAKYRDNKYKEKDGNLPARPERAARAVAHGVGQAIVAAPLGDVTHGSRREGLSSACSRM